MNWRQATTPDMTATATAKRTGNDKRMNRPYTICPLQVVQVPEGCNDSSTLGNGQETPQT